MITGPGPEEAPQLSLGEEGRRESILGDVHPSSVCRVDWGVPGWRSSLLSSERWGLGELWEGASVESEAMGRQGSKQPEQVGEKF